MKILILEEDNVLLDSFLELLLKITLLMEVLYSLGPKEISKILPNS
jgi:hypothetical protein